MSVRPAFMFYPAEWRGNAKLRRCSPAARGAWIDVICLFHDSDEYGLLRWPLADIAQAAGCELKLLRELAAKDVLKGSDKGLPEPFVFRPRHGGREGDPVTLIQPTDGPLWFSSRMVRDEYVRMSRGGSTRFTPERQPDKADTLPDDRNRQPNKAPTGTPTRPVGDGSGDGPSVAVAVSVASTRLGVGSTDGEGTAEHPLPEGLSAKTWADWKAHLARRGKGYTDIAEPYALTQLAKHRDPEAIVAGAMAAGHVTLPPVGGWPSQRARVTAADQRAEVAAAMFPGGAHDQRPDDIDGIAERVA